MDTPLVTVTVELITQLERTTDLDALYSLGATHQNLEAIGPVVHKCKKLRSIDLSYNHIKSVDESEFQNLHDLKELRLSSNHLTEVCDQVFQQTPQLVTLYLNDNDIVSVEMLRALPKLRTLWLQRNQVTNFSRDAIPLSVETLDLSSNPLLSLKGLAPHINLKELYLSDVIPRSAISAPELLRAVSILSNLEELHLNDNELDDDAPFNMLRGLRKLATIQLNNNRISKLSSLPVLKSVNELYLASNQLQSLASIANRFPALDVLDLDDNELGRGTELGALVKQLRGLPNLSDLHMKGNAICQASNYRSTLCRELPQLESLDGRDFDRADESLTRSPSIEYALTTSLSMKFAPALIEAIQTRSQTPAAVSPRRSSSAPQSRKPMRRPPSAGPRGKKGALLTQGKALAVVNECRSALMDHKESVLDLLRSAQQAIESAGLESKIHPATSMKRAPVHLSASAPQLLPTPPQSSSLSSPVSVSQRPVSPRTRQLVKNLPRPPSIRARLDDALKFGGTVEEQKTNTGVPVTIPRPCTGIRPHTSHGVAQKQHSEQYTTAPLSARGPAVKHVNSESKRRSRKAQRGRFNLNKRR